MIKVVLDTNLLVSSFFGGNRRGVIDLWKNGQITICLTQPILDEYVQVLHRLGLQDENELAELLNLFATSPNVLYTRNSPVLSIVDKDSDDYKFFSCAVALQASYIISGDKAVIEIHETLGVKVLSPADFLYLFSNQ